MSIPKTRGAPALALTSLIAMASVANAQTLPSGAITHCADIQRSGHTLTVSQLTANCVIDWARFDVGRGGIVEFLQGGSWRLLNRVSDAEFTRIAGTLRADGTIYLVSPGGVAFKDGAVVEVGQLYAAAGHLSNADFAAGNDRFTDVSGSVVNAGSIDANAVHLLGSEVANRGTIVAPGGTISLLAANDTVYLAEEGGRLLVEIDGADLGAGPGGFASAATDGAGVRNTGSVRAADGQVVLGVGDMYSLAIRNQGTIAAPGGDIRLAAQSGRIAHDGGSLRADTVTLSGEMVALAADIVANEFAVDGPVTLSEDVNLIAATDPDAQSVVFDSTIEGPGALAVEGDARFGGHVAAGALHVGGDVTLTQGGQQTIIATTAIDIAGDLEKSTGGGIVMEAASGMAVGGAITAPGGGVNLTAAAIAIGDDVTSGGSVVTTGSAVVGGSVTAGNDVRFFGDGAVAGGVTAGDDVVFNANATVGGSVVAPGDLKAFGDAIIGGDVSTGMDAEFRATAQLGGDLDAGDDVEFDGDAVVMGTITSGDDVTFAGLATVGGAVIAEGDVDGARFVSIGGKVRSGDDVTFLEDAEVGGAIVAADDVEIHGDATVGGSVRAGDDVVVLGDAIVGGNVTATGDVELLGAASIDGGVDAGDDLIIADAAVIGGDVTSVDDMVFGGTVDIGGDVSAGDDLLVASDARIGGAVHADDDVEIGGSAWISGDVTTGDDVDVLGSRATFGGDVIAQGGVTIDGRLVLKGAGDQRIAALGASFRARQSVRKTTAGALTLESERLILSGRRIMAIDDVRLNPDGREDVPDLATIWINRNQTIRSSRGDVVIGPREKATVAGRLMIDAADKAWLGDITTLGSLSVSADRILLHTRPAGTVLTEDGDVLFDRGLDFVAGGRFSFSTAPRLVGSHPVPVFASAQADGDATGALSRFRLRVSKPIRPSALRGDLGLVDFVADGAVIVNLAEALAEARIEVEDRPTPVRPRTVSLELPNVGPRLGR